MENIKIDLIIPHKDNPRKDLGDLTELADSIRENGIFQNLTVHDNQDGTYTAIIGHRRLAAAKLAGLTEVLCAVVNMDTKTQASTMLLENMQRNDLTAYEQAQGFQLCLDLGMTKTEVSKKTGFSRTTVNHRLEMLKLDREKLAEVKGGTIEDYIKLEQIESEEKRNELLKCIGTSNFNFQVNQIVEKEKKEKARAKQIEILNTFATEVEKYPYDKEQVRYYNSSDTITVPKDHQEKKYYFHVNYGITVYTDKDLDSEAAKPTVNKKTEARNIRRAALVQAFEIAKETRFEFINGVREIKAKNSIFSNTVLHAMLDWQVFDGVDVNIVKELWKGYKSNFDGSFSSGDELREYIANLKINPETYILLFYSVYSMFETCDSTPTADWNLAYEKSEMYEALYEFLKELDYKISDEEQQLIDGTHELFKKSEDKE